MFPLCGQVPHYDFDPITIHTLDRLHILYPSFSSLHSSIRYQSPKHLLEPSENYIEQTLAVSDKSDFQMLLKKYSTLRLFQDSLNPISENKGLINTFYKDPYHFWTINSANFYMALDPIFFFGAGDDQSNKKLIFQNTRGFKLQGVIDKKVYFYTSLYENQRNFFDHIENRIDRFSAIPGQGFYKNYQSGVLSELQGWDYLNAQGYLGINLSQSIDMQFGHGNNFIGNGLRSMLLSDYSHNYFYLKINTKIWKIHYQNLFAELSAISSKDNVGNQLLPKKYMASHYLDLKISDHLSIGLFEAIIFSRDNQFELQYLNPVILYRSIEQFLDSPDNALLGININTTIKERLQLYGQLMIDELRTDELFNNSGWWGNKIGFQIGGQYINMGNIDHLDGRIEYNSARPYTYAHRSVSQTNDFVTTSYSHFNQPLAHPLGANFTELLSEFKYSLDNTWFFNLRFVYARYGDSLSENVGNNILLNYETRTNDFGNYTTQGFFTTVSLLSVTGTYQFYPNYFVDIEYFRRIQNSELKELSFRTNYIGISVRANMFNQNIDH